MGQVGQFLHGSFLGDAILNFDDVFHLKRTMSLFFSIFFFKSCPEADGFLWLLKEPMG